MFAIRKKMLVVVFAAAVCAFAMSAAAAQAKPLAGAEDTWVPPSWAASSPSTSFTGPGGFTVSCTSNTASGSSVGTGPDLGPLTMNAPTFKNCTDNVTMGNDTVTVAKSGWKVSFVSDSADPGCPSGTGNDEVSGSDCVVITVPQNAAKIALGNVPGCTLTVQPSGPTTVGATANDPGGTTKDTFVLAGDASDTLSFSASAACPIGGGTAQFSGTYTLSKPNSGVLVDGS